MRFPQIEGDDGMDVKAMDLDLDLGPGDWTGLDRTWGNWDVGLWDLQEQREMRWVFPGDSSFLVSKVGRPVGGTCAGIRALITQTRCAGCCWVQSDEKRGKERNQAATDKTSFLQDSTQESAAQDRPAPVVRSRSQIYLCTWTCRILRYCSLAGLGTTRAQRQGFFGSCRARRNVGKIQTDRTSDGVGRDT